MQPFLLGAVSLFGGFVGLFCLFLFFFDRGVLKLFLLINSKLQNN